MLPLQPRTCTAEHVKELHYSIEAAMMRTYVDIGGPEIACVEPLVDEIGNLSSAAEHSLSFDPISGRSQRAIVYSPANIIMVGASFGSVMVHEIDYDFVFELNRYYLQK